MFTHTEYATYPVSQVLLEPCEVGYDTSTVRSLLKTNKQNQICAEQANADKKRIAEELDGGFFSQD